MSRSQDIGAFFLISRVIGDPGKKKQGEIPHSEFDRRIVKNPNPSEFPLVTLKTLMLSVTFPAFLPDIIWYLFR